MESEKIKVFVGGKSTGKTSKARLITYGKKVSWIDAAGGLDCFIYDFDHCINPDSEFIVVDSIKNESDFVSIVRLFFNENFTINVPREKAITIKRPKVILICDFTNYEIFAPSIAIRVKFYTFPKAGSIDIKWDESFEKEAVMTGNKFQDFFRFYSGMSNVSDIQSILEKFSADLMPDDEGAANKFLLELYKGDFVVVDKPLFDGLVEVYETVQQMMSGLEESKEMDMVVLRLSNILKREVGYDKK